jgi:cell division protein FtsZ
MSINIGPPAVEELRPRITVIGVGGAGGNAIANMIRAGIEGVDFVVANTDAQALNNSICEHRIQLGPDITQGLGAGSRPEVGRAAAEETIAQIDRILEGVHMCFIAAGMGGGTGTGAAPVIAEAARKKGVLTVGVVTKPFLFEGTRRMRSADAGIDELQKYVDTLIVIPNQNLFLIAKAETTFKEAFQLADEVLQQGVRSITDLMVMPGLINLDFADVRSVMAEMGKAMMGTGEGEGPNRAREAAEQAIANPLLDGVSMQGAKGVIISIIGGEDMRLMEVDEAANHIRDLVDPDANIIWGSAFNPDLDGKIRVSVVATGIEQGVSSAESPSRTSSLGASLSAARGPARPGLSLPGVTAAPVAAPAPVQTPAAATFTVSEPDPVSFDTPEVPAAHVSEEPLELGTEHEAAPAAEHYQPTLETPAHASFVQAPAPVARPAQDELLLDASRLAEEDGQVGASLRRRLMPQGEAQDHAPEASAPATSPYSGGPAAGIGQQRLAGTEPARPVAPAAGGGTLFERMANLTGRRKAEDEEEAEDGAAINIPRFLGRQNNQ